MNLRLRISTRFRLRQLPSHIHQHRHHADHDPGLEDHAPVDQLHIPIADHLPFPAHRPSMTKVAEHLPLTDDDHHPDDAHQQIIDVIVLILHLAPELLVAIPEAVKSSYDQPHVRPIQASFPHLMLMTLGAIGTTATILQTTIAAPLDPDPLWDHHHLIHHQIHQQKQQHHLEPWPSVYRTVTVKPQMQRRLSQFPNSTKMTSNSVNLWKRPMIHTVYDA